MEQEKPYLQHSLTIDQLAEQVSMSPRLLSSIMNRYFKRNFFEFVNQYRIEEAKRLLAQRGMSVLDVLYSAGFNSKSTFNMLFKKSVGMPPSDYRKKVRVQSEAMEATTS
jgi:AraC-like DNA-binding protein